MKMNVSGMLYKEVEASIESAADRFAGFTCIGDQVFAEVSKPLNIDVRFVSFA